MQLRNMHQRSPELVICSISKNLRIVQEKYGIELLLGTELNIMNAQETDLPDSVLERLDIAVASIHMYCFKDERTMNNIAAAYEKVMDPLCGHHWTSG